MYLTTGLEREMGKFLDMAGGPIPTSLSGIVELLGGSLNAAKELGYNPPEGDKKAESNARRVVERYVNFEAHGKTPSNRQISKESYEKLHQAATDKVFGGLVDKMRPGLHVSGHMKLWISNGLRYIGERNVEGDMTGFYLDDFLEAWLNTLDGTGTVEDMAAAFTIAMMEGDDGYGFLGAEIDAGPDALERDDFEISLVDEGY